jgi:hypothetical protein
MPANPKMNELARSATIAFSESNRSPFTTPARAAKMSSRRRGLGLQMLDDVRLGEGAEHAFRGEANLAGCVGRVLALARYQREAGPAGCRSGSCNSHPAFEGNASRGRRLGDQTGRRARPLRGHPAPGCNRAQGEIAGQQIGIGEHQHEGEVLGRQTRDRPQLQAKPLLPTETR